VSATASAESHHNGKKYQAEPFVFIGHTSDCSPSPAGHRIVSSKWIAGLGLPDDGTTANPSSKRNDKQGSLLLSKNGPTPDCSAAGADIVNWRSGDKITAAGIGFDYRIGTHCGAGAPRFNVTTTDGKLYFVGCNGFGTHIPAPQDVQWERVTFTNPADFSPGNTTTPFNFGMSIKSISIIFDEGTDTPGLSDPAGVGLVTLDNININGSFITTGESEDEGHEKH
jgi:hypothetical protein